MKKLQTKILTGIITFSLLIKIFAMFSLSNIFADEIVHVRILGSIRTIFVGDVTLSGCTIKDVNNITYSYTNSFAVCSLDEASKTGKFTYAVKDLGSNLGLFIDQIAEDKGTTDLKSLWSYDINGKEALQSISNLTLKNGDTISFHFTNSNINIDQQAINAGILYLKSQQNINGSIQGSPGINLWASMAFSAEGIDISTVKNGNTSLMDYLANHPPTNSAPLTDWEKAILAITAAGRNPFDFGGINYESKLESFDNNSILGSTTQLDDKIFGLLALIASGSSASSVVKQDALNFIITHQNDDGGFSWSTTGTSGVDDTSAALQAIIAAQKNGMNPTELSHAISKAKTFLISEQKTDGGFVSSSSDSASNTATTSWAIMALSALGMESDDKTKNALNFIHSNQKANGSFSWQSSLNGETFTSAYAIQALTEKSWPLAIFSGSPVIPITPTPTTIPSLPPTDIPIINPSITPFSSPTLMITPKSTQNNKGNAEINYKEKQKELKNLLQDTQKKLLKTLKNPKKQNRTFYNQIQALIHTLNEKIRSFFT